MDNVIDSDYKALTVGQDGKTKMVFLFSLPLFTALMFFIFSKILHTLVPTLVEISKEIAGGHQVRLSFDLFSKIELLGNAVIAALNLWNVFPTLKFASVVIIYVTIGASAIFFYFLYNRNSKTPPLLGIKNALRGNCLRIVLLCSLVPLSVMPNLAADFNHLSFRMITALSVLVLIFLFFLTTRLFYIVFGENRYKAFMTLTMIPLLLFISFNCQAYLKKYVVNIAAAELKYFKSIIPVDRLSYIRRIATSGPNYKSARPEPAYFLDADEYGYLTTASEINTLGLYRCAVNECRKDGRDCGDKTILDQKTGVLIIDREALLREVAGNFDTFRQGL